MIFKIINDDCIKAMQAMAADSIDSVVCDPPYGLSFMGKSWDHAVPGVEYWIEALRVLKPGGHLVAFGGTRLYHRLTCAIEDAGFEIRDCLSWVYGTGMPKSLDVSKAIDKAAGAEREVIGELKNPATPKKNTFNCSFDKSKSVETAPATDDAKTWKGWGTNLKPAQEFICLARKPFKCTVAKNVLEYGTGALNIDGCRVGERWPANFVHDGSDEVLEIFPESKSGSRKEGVRKGRGYHGADGDGGPEIKASKGSASRFFYCAKASQAERNAGVLPGASGHPTQKPIALMAWLCRMVTPPDGTILDPFAGSGSTIVAAIREGFSGIGIEMEEQFADIAQRRCEHEEW